MEELVEDLQKITQLYLSQSLDFTGGSTLSHYPLAEHSVAGISGNSL